MDALCGWGGLSDPNPAETESRGLNVSRVLWTGGPNARVYSRFMLNHNSLATTTKSGTENEGVAKGLGEGGRE